MAARKQATETTAPAVVSETPEAASSITLEVSEDLALELMEDWSPSVQIKIDEYEPGKYTMLVRTVPEQKRDRRTRFN